MTKKVILIAILAIIIVGAVALVAVNLDKEETVENRVDVVVSNFASYDFLRAISQDVEGVNINFIVGPGKDIHSYDPSMQDIIEMQNADMLVYIGGELEAWSDTVIPTLEADELLIVKISDSVELKEEQAVDGAEEEEHEHDEDEEDHDEEEETETEFDTHIWTSPENAILMVETLTEKMIEIDSENAELYTANSEAYIEEIEALDVKIQEVVDNAENDRLVFGDKMPMQYFIDYYDLEVSAAFIGCSTETEPSTQTLTYLSDLVRDEDIPVVIYTELNDGTIANTIVNEAGNGAVVMQMQTLHNVTLDNYNAGYTYVDLMEMNIEVLEKALN